MSGKKYLRPMCAIFHKALCNFLPKNIKKLGMNDVIGNGTRLREVHGHILQTNKCKNEKTKVREKGCH